MNLLTELQFTQLENQELKSRLSSLKHQIELAKLEIKFILFDSAIDTATKNKLEQEGILLTNENLEKILGAMDKLIKTN